MLFEKYHPQVVFHAAAYKHVPLMEENLAKPYWLTSSVPDRCRFGFGYGAEKMIMVSTDKAVNPTNVMGASKRWRKSMCKVGTAIREAK